MKSGPQPLNPHVPKAVSKPKTPADVVVSQKRGPQYRPQNTIILIIGTPKKVPLILGNPQVPLGRLRKPQRGAPPPAATLAPDIVRRCQLVLGSSSSGLKRFGVEGFRV